MSVLKRIIKAKKAEVKQKKEKMPVSEFLKEIAKYPANRNFKDVLENNDFTIIGEKKKKAPSTGVIKAAINVKEIAQQYERSGVGAISVVTDKKFFDGRLEYIKEVKKYCSLPVLRKDFIIDEYQIYESRWARADAILLIASLLEKRVLTNFVKKARFLNMTPVVETHTREEIKKAVASGADVIGINARDLKTFKVNLSRVASLANSVPRDKIVICESGINRPEDLNEAGEGGRLKAALIGTALMKMKPKDMQQFVSDIIRGQSGR